jgi:hypothetical protein
MTARQPDRPPCARCDIAERWKSGPYCADCSRTINRIIARAAEGDIADEELADMLGLSLDALYQRRSRIVRRQEANP